MSEKLDLYKVNKSEYVMPKEPALVDVRPAKYLTLDGEGEPGSERFQAAIGALYGCAFTIKMTRKFAGQDYRVCHLEGLWTGDQPRQSWKWKLMIRVPEFINARDLKEAVEKLKSKGKGAEAGQVRLETIKEGKCIQVLHVGPYSDEGETVRRMIAFEGRQGLTPHGPHHEIYLSDPRRVAAERLRTILRQPVS
jgi:hypothetical protein